MALTDSLLTGGLWISIIAMAFSIIYSIYVAYLNYKQAKILKQAEQQTAYLWSILFELRALNKKLKVTYESSDEIQKPVGKSKKPAEIPKTKV